MGYISRAAIDTILAGGTADLSREVHVYAPAPGEGAENGIASCREGAVILTNLACYLLRANGGVEVVWRTPFTSCRTGLQSEKRKTPYLCSSRLQSSLATTHRRCVTVWV